MGGFIENPPPPAPDVPPENAFDVQLFAKNVAKELRAAGAPSFSDEALAAAANKGFAALVAFIIQLIGHDAGKILGILLKAAMPMLEAIITAVGEILGPASTLLQDLTGLYVQQTVSELQSVRPGGAGQGPSGLKPAAAGLFDSILAPLGFLAGGVNPAEPGAGEANSQYALGSVVAIHLSTWALNIISNLTGLGFLHYINSFDDVITSAISARGLSRTALKPYLEKFMADPLTGDLNRKYPITDPGPGSLVKAYLRGGMSREQLIAAMRSKGFNETFAGQLLLDTARELPVAALVDLVRLKTWTQDQAVEQIVSTGYPKDLARALFVLEFNSLVDAIHKATAGDVMEAYADRRLNAGEARLLLESLGLTREEIAAYLNRGGTQREIHRRLSESQVRQLFQEGLIDLGYVNQFLLEEGYRDEDADLLVLLEFTRKEDREQRAAELKERRRVALEAQLDFDEAARIAREKELAALGGPTSA